MYAKEVSVQNHVGLHARPATFFIQKANEYKASVWVEKEERRVNAKSLLGVLSLGIVGGTTIKIIADGADEQEAVDALVKLVENWFRGVISAGRDREEKVRKAMGCRTLLFLDGKGYCVPAWKDHLR